MRNSGEWLHLHFMMMLHVELYLLRIDTRDSAVSGVLSVEALAANAFALGTLSDLLGTGAARFICALVAPTLADAAGESLLLHQNPLGPVQRLLGTDHLRRGSLRFRD